MNAPNHSSSRRALAPLALLPLTGAGLLLVATGCSHRPIVVQAPPATVIQAPAATPAPTAVIETAPAPTPTGRDVVIVKEAPPPPRAEPPPPPAPSTEYRWVPGYWVSRDGRQDWVAGHWEMPPRPTATWIAPRWERRGDGYVYVDGYWQ